MRTKAANSRLLSDASAARRARFSAPNQGADCLPQVLAGNHGRDGYQFGRLAVDRGRQREPAHLLSSHCRGDCANVGYRQPSSSNRAPHREDREPLGMETIAGIVMLAVVLVFVGIALDAARRAK